MAIILPITGSSSSGSSGASCNPFPKGSCATYLGWRNIFSEATAIAASSGDAFKAVDWLPWTRWEPTDPGTVRSFDVTLPEPMSADYIAIQGWNFGGGQLQLQYLDGSTWVEVMFIDEAAISPERPVQFRLFDTVTSDRWRVRILNHGTETWISSIAVGESLVLPSQPVGFTPPALSRETKISNNIGETGLPLGRSILRLATAFNIQAEFVTIEWAMSEWLSFVKHAEKFPFFFWWDVGGANDAALCWSPDEIPKTPWMNRLYLRASIDVRGLLQ